MSLVAEILAGRQLPAVEATAEAGADAASLAGLRVGDEAVVTGFAAAAPAATTRRLHDLGFAPGAPVDVVRKAPLGDPVVFRVAGYEIALRREQAKLIRVDA
ncbi:ferrous iron transport protein A [Flexivirga sp. ID2601S]|uniref:Ferrous iron transport protein A n=1 Tax=Flexivirga aerilata TaxID=1656889 RepID=A0A849ANM6_9MICO|nr:FeoA family protein [Flexivirga aerilata]NNG41106.1 ferrous iron transport protein A [Flexivirga aerilata]